MTGEYEPPRFLSLNLTAIEPTSTAEIAVRASILLAIYGVAFIFNLLLAIGVLKNSILRKKRLCILVANTAIVNLLECVCNMSLALGATIVERWDFPKYLCSVNDFCMTLCSCEIIFTLATMAADQVVRVFNHKQRDSANVFCISVSVFMIWFIGCIVTIPILTTVVHSDIYPGRYTCAISGNSPLAYSAILLSVCFLLPIVLCIICYIIVMVSALNERIYRGVVAQRDYTDSFVDRTPYWDVIDESKMTGLLFGLYLVLHGPYLAFSFFETIYRELQLNSTSESSYPVVIDTIFTWLRFSNALMLPIVSCAMREEIRRSLKSLFTYRRVNLAVNSDTDQSLVIPELPMQPAEPKVSIPAPTLFATSKGLIKTFGERHHRNYSTSDYDSETEEDSLRASLPLNGDLNSSDPEKRRRHSLPERSSSLGFVNGAFVGPELSDQCPPTTHSDRSLSESHAHHPNQRPVPRKRKTSQTDSGRGTMEDRKNGKSRAPVGDSNNNQEKPQPSPTHSPPSNGSSHGSNGLEVKAAYELKVVKPVPAPRLTPISPKQSPGKKKKKKLKPEDNVIPMVAANYPKA